MTVVDHGPVTRYEVTPQWQNYLDVEQDMKPWLQFALGAQITPEQAVQLASVTTMACTWVQNYLGRPVAPTTYRRRFNGWSGLNGAYVCLPYYPVLEVLEVNEWWGIAGPHPLNEETPEKQGNMENFQVDPLRGIVARSFMGLVERPWFPGLGNIVIEWVAGYNPVPEDIKLATKEFAAHWWRNTQQAIRTFAVPGADYDTTVAAGLWAGVPMRIEALLKPYMQVGIA